MRRHIAARVIGAMTTVMATVMTCVLMLGIAPAQADDIYEAYPDHQYPTHENTSMCIDNKTQDTTVAQIWRCSGASEQKWHRTVNFTGDWFQFKNVRFGGCLGVRTISATYAIDVAVIPCSAPDSVDMRDKWAIYWAYNDRNPVTGTGGWYNQWATLADPLLCLSRDGGPSNGVRLKLAVCNLHDIAQQWDIYKY